MKYPSNRNTPQSVRSGLDMAGSWPIFPRQMGGQLASGLYLPDFTRKRLIFNQFTYPGQAHVYRTRCQAGERLRAQMYVPVLPWGGAVVPAFAIVAQSLPYSADIQKLPMELPAGYSAIVAPPPSELVQPTRDSLTRVHYYPGPVIDTRTLVGGHCYLVVWSPANHMGKYVIQSGHRWTWSWFYWVQLPVFWWQIRGWFGLNRTEAYLAGAGLLAAVSALYAMSEKRKQG